MIQDNTVRNQMATARRVRHLCQDEATGDLYNYGRLEKLLERIQPPEASPLALEGDYVSGREERPCPESARDGSSTCQGRILLVDDEPEVREMACSALEMRGYIVTLCSNGQEALDHYRANSESIDLVVSDVVMPEMNGRELLENLQQVDPDVKVILMSGYCTETTASTLLDEGASAFLSKPFSLDELWDAADSALTCEGRTA